MINFFTKKLYNFGVSVGNIPGVFGGKILRTCVFQHVENGGLFERCLVRIYKLFSQRVCSIGYDKERAQRARVILDKFGAKFDTISVEGNLIDAMALSPQILEERIQKLGGSWKKSTLRNGDVVFAITPPSFSSQEWITLEQHFSHFNWIKKEGVIVTCPSAESIASENNLFIQLNSASTSYVMLQKKMGFFLGAKQTVVVFDPPGTGLSKGVATEGSYYSAVKAVFERYSSNYSLNRIWICGTCLGCASVAYMKSKIPNLNLLLENGFVDLQEDMVKPEGRFPYWFAKRYAQSLSRNDSEETNFNIEKMWKTHTNLGKVIVVSVDNDQRLSPKVPLKLVSIARNVSSSVRHIHYHSSNRDAHFSRFNDFPDVSKQILSSIFESKSGEFTVVEEKF